MFTCRNPSCGKDFDKPLKTVNLQESPKPYLACPFCLTKIGEQVEINTPEIQEEPSSSEEKSSRNTEKPETCHYHVGYLSEREDKKQIPDECIVCNVLIECMLQKMKK